jgi:hypothetical protein
MPFIGNQPALSYTSFAKQDFTTSATTSYTLDNPVANENEIALFINFVRQEPTTAYTASGTSLTLTSATSASDDMYCVFLGKAVQTVNPPSGSVGISQLSATGTKDATTFLRGDNTFASAGVDMTPAFEAFLSANTAISDNAQDKIQCNLEVYDTDNAYDNSTNFRFQPQTSGKYFVYARATFDDGAGALRQAIVYIFKNGSQMASSKLNFDNSSTSEGEGASPQISTVIDMNGSSDYLEIFGELDSNDGGTANIQGNTNVRQTNFGAFKLIGV